MSMFICAACEGLKDSDDGCEEYKHHQLICIDCMNDRDDEEPERERVYSREEIYRTLISQGCPEDIASELAKEKGK